MIKAHSMGIGDILRSSAAWRAMKNSWPGVELHLLFLSRHAGYPSESLIHQHHLLSSATFLTIREGVPYAEDVRKVPNWKILRQVWDLSRSLKPDWVIDFEWAGSRTSVVTAVARMACGAKSLGIQQFPMRGMFYTHTAPSTSLFAKKHGLTEPFDYTFRDFVVLEPWDIFRGETAIELRPDASSVAWVSSQITPKSERLRVGLNIGCATFGASHKRMPLDQLARCFKQWMSVQPLEIILTGAPNEREFNQQFIAFLKEQGGDVDHVIDMAGQTNMLTLTALIDACEIFVSSDSGPYHMAVALKKPTLCWLMYEEKTSFHQHPWVRCLVNPSTEAFMASIHELSLQTVDQHA
jgi:ADP-heptose:LPS heptosyltransferase